MLESLDNNNFHAGVGWLAGVKEEVEEAYEEEEVVEEEECDVEQSVAQLLYCHFILITSCIFFQAIVCSLSQLILKLLDIVISILQLLGFFLL